MYVVCYDITDTKRRNKIFKTLKNYGQHKQYSVFECDITKARYKEMLYDWQKAKSTFTSIHFWENYLGLKAD